MQMGPWWTRQTSRRDAEPVKPKGGRNPDNGAAGWGGWRGDGYDSEEGVSV